HLVGAETGYLASKEMVESLLRSCPAFKERLKSLPNLDEIITGAVLLSYTQWEALLAIYHDKLLIVACPSSNAPRGAQVDTSSPLVNPQQAHLARLKALHKYP